MGRFLTASVLCICITSISELDVEELPESLSEVSELEVPESKVAEILCDIYIYST